MYCIMSDCVKYLCYRSGKNLNLSQVQAFEVVSPLVGGSLSCLADNRRTCSVTILSDPLAHFSIVTSQAPETRGRDWGNEASSMWEVCFVTA